MLLMAAMIFWSNENQASWTSTFMDHAELILSMEVGAGISPQEFVNSYETGDERKKKLFSTKVAQIMTAKNTKPIILLQDIMLKIFSALYQLFLHMIIVLLIFQL